MRRSNLGAACAALALMAVACGLALGQNQPGSVKLAGQNPGGAINQQQYDASNDKDGFADQSLTPNLVVKSDSTAQATFNVTTGTVLTGQVIHTKTTVITLCPPSTGVTLPALNRFTSIVIILRQPGNGQCMIWPSLGATVENFVGTDGAVNAPFYMSNNTDVTFYAINATRWLR